MVFDTPLDLALWRARSLVGTWYSWGGDDPQGFDCSGMVIECLQTAGLFPRGQDATAAALSSRYQSTITPRPGVLLFWAKGGSVVHVEMVLTVIGDQVFTVGASGGGSRTKTKEDAVRDNAFVKVRAAKPGWVAMVDPFVGYRV